MLMEDSEAVRFSQQIYEVERDGDLQVRVSVPKGMRIRSVSYPESAVSPRVGESANYNLYDITLSAVRYPTVVRVETQPEYRTVYELDTSLYITETSDRLRINALPFPADLHSGGKLAVGWQTEAGQPIGFGSRFFHDGGEMHLSPLWLDTQPETDFDFRADADGAVITGYRGSGSLVIPDTLGGLPVVGIAAGAFGDIRTDLAAFPPALTRMEDGAFASLEAEALYFFDGLQQVSDLSFGSFSVKTLHINAVQPPVYCGSYFDTLSEKIDYLVSLGNARKLVLFCGSSARFGYDSVLLESFFPDYRVVNLGVYAYANMLPQAKLMMQYLAPGDIVLSSPELDTISTQFCGTNNLDAETFAMLESNYAMLSLLDAREFTGIWDAFRNYQAARRGMEPRDYTDIPARFDEDGKPAPQLSYNRQGDYILYRPSNLDGKLFGIRRASYTPNAITEADWDGLNRIYDELTAIGVQVYFTYSPRSRTSVTPDSDPQALDEAMAARLHAPVISRAEDSLMDAVWFYGTDNHLTTQGAEHFTRRTAEYLRAAMEAVP